MAYIPLKITVISADVLQKPTFFNKPRAYAVIYLTGDSVSRQTTPVDERGGAKPHWDFTLTFQVDQSDLQRNSAVLVLQLCRYRTFGDKDIGSIYVPVKELFENAGGINRELPVAFPVSSKSGKPKGVVYLSYVFGEALDHLSPNNYVSTILSRDSRISRFPYNSEHKIHTSFSETTYVGGERVIGYPPPSAPPCPEPSAPYLPIDGCFPANPTPSAPY